jgi:formylglycine-generating enzyme required for sulfatase activity
MKQSRLTLILVVFLGLVLASCSLVGKRAPEPATVRVRESDGAEMVWVPGGEYTIGLTEADVDAVMAECSRCRRSRVDNACPQHTVHLEGFWIDRQEVTNRQYRQCVEAGVCTVPQHITAYDDLDRANEPVTATTWYQAVDYAHWVGGRLPTEVEWEAACAGPYGLEGTAGKVWEWTSTLGYPRYPYDPTDGREDPELARPRVIRGASWILEPGVERCAFRYYSPMEIFSDQIGIRVAISGGQ